MHVVGFQSVESDLLGNQRLQRQPGTLTGCNGVPGCEQRIGESSGAFPLFGEDDETIAVVGLYWQLESIA